MNNYEGVDVLENLESAKNYNRALAERVSREIKGPVVLDFGSGSGTFARLLQNESRKIYCVEKDENYRKTLEAEGFSVSDSPANYPDDFFTDVYTLNVLEHVEDDASALKGLWNVMQVGGRLIVFVPAHPILYSSFDKRIGHFRRYTRRSLENVLGSVGFTVTHTEFFDFFGYFVAVGYRILDRGEGKLTKEGVRVFDSTIFPLSRRIDYLFRGLLGKNLFVVAEK